MDSFLSAKSRFVQAQNVALAADNDFNELMAIGMQELTDALAKELTVITAKLQAVEQRAQP